MARRMGAKKSAATRNGRRRTAGAASRASRRIVLLPLLLALCALCAVSAAAGIGRLQAWARTSGRFVVQAIEVSGAQGLDSAAVAARLGITAGMSLLDVDAGRITRVLSANPLVKSVRVRRLFSGRVRVAVQERTPVALVALGTVHGVDASGVLLPLQPGRFMRLPVVSGLRDTLGSDGLRRLSGQSQSRLTGLLAQFDRSDREWRRHVSQIDLTDADVVRLSLEGYPASIEVCGIETARAMEQLRRLLETLAAEDGARVRAIRLSYGTVAYVRRETGR